MQLETVPFVAVCVGGGRVTVSQQTYMWKYNGQINKKGVEKATVTNYQP